MSDFENLKNQIQPLLDQSNPLLPELRKAMLEIEDFMASDDFPGLAPEDRALAQDLRRDLKTRLRQAEEQIAPPVNEAGIAAPPDNGAPLAPARPRNPLAEQQMEDAEKLFYSGRYTEAIRLFDRVLQLEPSWDRARQHRAEAENYLRTGYIPPVALPSEAASAFGKAQSAARVGRFADAMTMLQRAQTVMRDLGIQRWQEGLEFEQKLQENIDAENAYQEGMQLFEQGKIDEAIERVETAAHATGLPKYADRAQALRRFKELTRTINEALSAPTVEPKIVTQSKSDLDLLLAEHGENPALLRLRTRLEASVPRAIAPLQEQARALKAQAERATTLDEAQYLAKQAKVQIEQIRNLGGLDEALDRLQTEIERIQREVARFQDELAQANASLELHRTWPAQAEKLSLEVCQRYPNDPSVARLNRSLGSFRLRRTLVFAGLGLLALALLAVLGWYGMGRYRTYQLAQTPTVTPTFTLTPTFTPTLTATPTFTLTPTPTLTFTPTATPSAGLAQRDLWARSGCYESFNAVGRIPTAGRLRFLPSERRFDEFNRECVLVEYQGQDRSVIGWILLVDVGAAPPAASTGTPAP